MYQRDAVFRFPWSSSSLRSLPFHQCSAFTGSPEGARGLDPGAEVGIQDERLEHLLPASLGALRERIRLAGRGGDDVGLQGVERRRAEIAAPHHVGDVDV